MLCAKFSSGVVVALVERFNAHHTTGNKDRHAGKTHNSALALTTTIDIVTVNTQNAAAEAMPVT
ncbi:MAG: hypothetical protein IPN04_08505 [Rhodoferax sp.]|nr:hypothetical protein [Rhodoferax sp.]